MFLRKEFPSGKFYFGVEFTAYKEKMVKESVLTTSTLYDARRSFAPRAL